MDASNTPRRTAADVCLFWFRWIALLPAAAFAGTMIRDLALAGIGLVDATTGAPIITRLEYIAGDGLFAFFFVIVGVVVAPAYRRITTFAISGLMLIFVGLAIADTLTSRDWWKILTPLAMIVGTVMAITKIAGFDDVD